MKALDYYSITIYNYIIVGNVFYYLIFCLIIGEQKMLITAHLISRFLIEIVTSACYNHTMTYQILPLRTCTTKSQRQR